MHTGNLLGQIPSPLPNEVFTDLVSTNHFRISGGGHRAPKSA